MIEREPPANALQPEWRRVKYVYKGEPGERLQQKIILKGRELWSTGLDNQVPVEPIPVIDLGEIPANTTGDTSFGFNPEMMYPDGRPVTGRAPWWL